MATATSNNEASAVAIAGTSHQASQHMIEMLRQDQTLTYKLHVFMYDLRHFHSDVSSGVRIDAVTDKSYIGKPYFSDEEAAQLKHAVVDTDRTLEHFMDELFTRQLEKRLKTRRVETGDYRVCAAHDVAPLIEKAFNVQPRDLAKNKSFRALVQKHGLGRKR